jgi:protochlorophyllide reductase
VSRWSLADVPSLTGRTAVVTGANAGLGLETSRVLAARGARLVLACRDLGRAETAATTIRSSHPDAEVEVRRLDLADLGSVAAFATELLRDHDRLDLLVNNAGLMATDPASTADGFELQLGVNHLGHVALTLRLLPLVLATPGSRVTTVSSMGHRAAGRVWRDERLFAPRDQRWRPYFQSKLANLLFTAELQRRLSAAGADTVATAAHPGGSHTDLGSEGSGWTNRLLQPLVPLVAQPVAAGARPIVRAATDPDLPPGAFVGPRWLARGAEPRIETPARAARRRDDATWLWERSVELTGVSPVFR